MSSSTTKIRCTGRASLGRRGGGNRCLRPVGSRGRRRSRGCLSAAVLTLMPLASTLLEPLPALVVPRTARAVVALAAPPSRPEDRPDQEEHPDQEEREQEEPGEEPVVVIDHVHDLDLLAVRLRRLDLLRGVLLALILTGVVRRDA